jgi:hypothetical protein
LATFCWTKTLLCNDAFYIGIHLFRVLLEDSAQSTSQRNRIPCSRPDDVIFRPDAQLSKHHPSGQQELSIRTFPCVEKLRTVPACICPDVSAARPNATQYSNSYGISFQNTDIGRQLQPSRRCGSHPDALIHKASSAFKIKTSGRYSSWYGRSSFIYENCVHQINRSDDRSYGPDSRSLDMKIVCN